jgi:SAM-dependent methyltransferase
MLDISYPDVIHTFYDRPVLLRQVDVDLSGKRLLDIGCSSGSLTSCYVARGADVSGIDINDKAIDIAQRSLGDRAEFKVADVSDGIEFVPDNSVDIVSASLILDQIGDWAPALSAVNRVLKDAGVFAFSLHHPDWERWDSGNGGDGAAKLERLDESFTVRGHKKVRTIYRRPKSEILRAFTEAGLDITTILEPRPMQELELFRPDAYEAIVAEPWFLVLSARRSAPRDQPQ